MRMRKRGAVPLPLVSPVPILPDLNLLSPSPVQLPDQPHAPDLRRLGTTGGDSEGKPATAIHANITAAGDDDDEEEEEERSSTEEEAEGAKESNHLHRSSGCGSNHPNLTSSLDANSDYYCDQLPSSSSSSDQTYSPQEEEEKKKLLSTTSPGRWLDGEKNMPLKKRRASFQMMNCCYGVEVTTKMTMTTMMCKTNKKAEAEAEAKAEDNNNNKAHITTDGDDYSSIVIDADYNTTARKKIKQQLGSSSIGSNTNKINNAKKKTKKSSSKPKKTGTPLLMQGSRCSRVNGRGWRCCQPTLVGYSLCDHHLGKGRLRSISTVTLPSSSSTNLPKLTTSITTTSPSSTISPPSSPSPFHSQKKKKKQKNTTSTTTINHVDAITNASDDEEEEDDHSSIQQQQQQQHHHHPIMSNKHCSKKRTRVGLVKARSLSSLLGQPNTMVLPHHHA